MNETKHTIALFFCLFFVFSCSSHQTQNTADPATNTAGTIILNPKPPSNNIFADFEEKLGPSYPVTQDNDQIAHADKVAHYSQDIKNMIHRFLNPAIVKEYDFSTMYDMLKDFGETAATAIHDQFPLGFTSETQELVLNESISLFDDHTIWTLKFKTYDKDDRFNLIYFINSETNFIHAAYLYRADENNTTVKGSLYYTNPDVRNSPTQTMRRVLSITFDFTTVEHVLVFRFDRRDKDGVSFAGQSFVQCNETSLECITENHEIMTTPPLRHMSTPLFRSAYTEESSTACLARLDYQSNSVEPDFILEYNLETQEVIENACSIKKPAWGDHVFTTDDLLLRYEDTEPFGGSFQNIFQDGTATTGWEQYLTPELIDATINASHLIP